MVSTSKFLILGATCAVLASALTAREVHIDVPGMHCPLCTATVKKALLSVEGVESAKVKLATKSADVVVKDSVKDETLLEAVAKTGYPGVIKK